MFPESTAAPPVGKANANGFTTTLWTRVLLARDPSSTQARDALAELCRAYWYPLYAFLRRSGLNPEDACDRVQEFFARLLGENWLAQVDRSKGRFRSFLLAALKHFVANEWDKEHALKRGGREQLISFDQLTAEARYGLEPSHAETPDRLFERRWALLLLDRALERLKEEYARQGKALVFEELKGTLEGGRDVPYAELGRRMGASPGAVKVTVHRLRRRYREILHEEVAQTIGDAIQLDEELRSLIQVLRN